MSDLASDRQPDKTTIDLLKTHFDYDATDVAQTPSPVFNYFGGCERMAPSFVFSR